MRVYSFGNTLFRPTAILRGHDPHGARSAADCEATLFAGSGDGRGAAGRHRRRLSRRRRGS